MIKMYHCFNKNNTENFAFITFLGFKLLSSKVLFINKKDNRNCEKVDFFLRKSQNSRVNYCKTMNVKLSGYT